MDRLLEIVLSNTAVAAALAILAVASRRLCARPALSHALWLLVLLKLLTPPLRILPIAALAPQSPPSRHAQPLPPAAPAVLLTPPACETRVAIIETEDSANVAHAPQTHATEIDPAPAVPAPIAPPPAPTPAAAPAYRAVIHWPHVLLAGWLAGSLLCAAIIVRRLRRFQVLLRFARPADDMVRVQADAAAHRLGLAASPEVWFVPGDVCPMLIALGGRARLLIPRGLWQRLDHRQHGTLLLHELAHLRRRDHWVRLLEIVACIIYWWHPLAWWARRELRRVEEQCCDAWVLWAEPGSGADYAAALLEAIDVSSRARPLPALASGMGEFHDLKRRLTMIQQGTNRKAMGWVGFLSVCGLGALLLPIAPLRAQPVAVPPATPTVDQPDAPLTPPAPPAVEAPDPPTAPVPPSPVAQQQLDRSRARLARAEQQLAEAHARLRELAEKLAQAEKRLAELEAMRGGARMPLPGAMPMPAGSPPTGRPTPRFPGAAPATPRAPVPDPFAAPRPGAARRDRADRLAELEVKLTQILEEVQAMKAESGAAPAYAVTAAVPGIGTITTVVSAPSASAAIDTIRAKYPDARIMSVTEMAAAPAAK